MTSREPPMGSLAPPRGSGAACETERAQPSGPPLGGGFHHTVVPFDEWSFT